MTPHNSTIRKLLRASLLASVTMAMIAVAIGSAAAGDDDDEDELPDVKIFRSILGGIGLKKDGAQDGIDYRERSPLVVPPTRDLPPPEAPGAGAAANPAFPVDQDEKRRKQAKRTRSANWDWMDLSKPLSPNEMKRGTAAPGTVRNTPSRTVEENNAAMKPSELGYKGGLFDFGNFFSGNNGDEVGKFESEPPRTSLVDPPAGYRTPSPTQRYGVSKDTTPSKPQDIYDRPVTGSGASTH